MHANINLLEKVEVSSTIHKNGSKGLALLMVDAFAGTGG